MPIYEYRCNCCQNEFELLVRGATEPACPRCGNDKITRKMSTFAVGNGNQTDTSSGQCSACGRPPGSCAFGM